MSAYSVLTRATSRAASRDWTARFFTFVFPLVFLCIFGLLYRGQEVSANGGAYIENIASGVLSWGVANAAVFGVGFTLMQWRNNDLLRLIRMSPAPLRSVLGARYTVALQVAGWQTLLTVAVGVLLGLRINGPWPLLVPVMILGVTVFLAIGAVIGSLANTPEAVAAVANCLMVPMAFLSGSFLPLEYLPPWVRTLSNILPLRPMNDAVAGALTGRHDLAGIAVSCGVLAVFGIVFSVIAAKTFRWSNST